jgi:hypothetical protein
LHSGPFSEHKFNATGALGHHTPSGFRSTATGAHLIERRRIAVCFRFRCACQKELEVGASDEWTAAVSRGHD